MTRRTLVLALFAALSLAATAAAQNGAASTWPVPCFVAIGTDDTVLTIGAPGFEGCLTDDEAYPFYGPEGEFFGPVPGMIFWSVQGVPSAPPVYLHLVLPGSGALNAGWIGDMAVRVYRGANVAEQFRLAPQKCVFLRDGPLVAKGIARFNFSDANDGGTGPGASQRGWVLRGTLDNVAVDGCGSTVELKMRRRWVTHLNGDTSVTKLTASQGPSLTCP